MEALAHLLGYSYPCLLQLKVVRTCSGLRVERVLVDRVLVDIAAAGERGCAKFLQPEKLSRKT